MHKKSAQIQKDNIKQDIKNPRNINEYKLDITLDYFKVTNKPTEIHE